MENILSQSRIVLFGHKSSIILEVTYWCRVKSVETQHLIFSKHFS
jgi:hypothetical protein